VQKTERKEGMKVLFVAYDNEGAHNILPIGTTYVAAYLDKHADVEISFYNQDVYHYPESHLTKYLSENKFDVVAMGFVAGYFQYRKVLALCEAVNKAKHRPFLVLGGNGPTPTPEFYMEKTGADAIVLGEGEVPFCNLVKALMRKKPLSGVKGIAYRDGKRVVINEREKPIMNLDDIPFPYYKGLPMEYYVNGKLYHFGMQKTDRYLGMVTSRGCPYSCNFCLKLEPSIRFRSGANVAEELKKIIKDHNVTFIVFWDDLFMFSEKRVYELTEAILRNNIKIHYWCTGRLNIVNKEILRMMKRSGCVYIDYGIEQFDNGALKAMNKRLTENQIIKGIELTQKEGVHVAFNLIFGNVGDSEKTLRKSVALLNKYNDFGQLRVIRPVTPYPGTPLYNLCIEKGWLEGPADFYKKHKNLELLTVNFTDIPDDKFHQLLFEVNKDIIERYYKHAVEENIESFRKAYFEKDFNFRGARHQ
jgi:anaerobic magnesium-protoporphyrin IX monomethyl ester cyclase